jgi:DNA-binding transcriptional MerR regulator
VSGVNTRGRLRIGELSKRAGVSPELLRAWERRYALVDPERSEGGLRLYSDLDAERVELMRKHLAEGLAAAEAAELAKQAVAAGESQTAAVDLLALGDELAQALDRFDEARAQAVFDRAVAAVTVETLLSVVVLPCLRRLGDRWARGEVSVAQEHFASDLLRGRLLGLARGWGLGVGPTAVLACLPGERHELGLIAFGLALRRRGWRIVYLGADTPLETIDEVSRDLDPAVVVVVGVDAARVRSALAELGELATRHRVALGGLARYDVGPEAGLLALTGDPIAEAERVSVLAA